MFFWPWNQNKEKKMNYRFFSFEARLLSHSFIVFDVSSVSMDLHLKEAETIVNRLHLAPNQKAYVSQTTKTTSSWTFVQRTRVQVRFFVWKKIGKAEEKSHCLDQVRNCKWKWTSNNGEEKTFFSELIGVWRKELLWVLLICRSSLLFLIAKNDNDEEKVMKKKFRMFFEMN